MQIRQKKLSKKDKKEKKANYVTIISQEVGSTCVGNIVPAHTQYTQKFLYILSFSKKFLHISS